MLRLTIPLLLFLGAIVYLWRFIPDIDLETFSLLSPEIWLLIILLFLIVQLLNIWYFKIILARMCTIHSIAKLSQILFASYSFNYAGPLKLGMPLRVFLFKQVLAVPYGVGIATVVATTGLDVLVMITLVLSLSAWIYLSPFVGLSLALFVCAIFIGLVALSRSLPFQRPKWLSGFLADLANLSPSMVLGAIFLSATKLVCMALASWIVLAALGAPVGFTQLTFVYFSSHLAGLLSLVPMGLGIKDASIIGLLTGMNTSPSITVAFVAVDRLMWSVIPLLIGLLAGWHLGIGEIVRSVRSESELDEVSIS